MYIYGILSTTLVNLKEKQVQNLRIFQCKITERILLQAWTMDIAWHGSWLCYNPFGMETASRWSQVDQRYQVAPRRATKLGNCPFFDGEVSPQTTAYTTHLEPKWIHIRIHTKIEHTLAYFSTGCSRDKPSQVHCLCLLSTGAAASKPPFSASTDSTLSHRFLKNGAWGLPAQL